MTDQPPPPGDRTITEVAYFMIRVERTLGKRRAAVAGTIERLGSGEKQRFRDADELLRLVAGGWGGAPPRAPQGLREASPP